MNKLKLADKTQLLKIGIISFLILELTAILIGIWPILNQPKLASSTYTSLRLGVIPTFSKKNSQEIWSQIAQQFSNKCNISISPYYCNSHDEAIYGLLYGSLDLVIVNAVVSSELKKQFDAESLLIKDLDNELENHRSVLVARKNEGTNFLSQTSGLRFSNVNRYSLAGALIVNEFIESKINEPIKNWFSEISYAGTHHQSVINLIKNDTDLISVNYSSLKESMKMLGYSDDMIQILWMSTVLPEPVLCCRSDLDRTIQNELINAVSLIKSDQKRNRLRFRRLDESFTQRVGKTAQLGNKLKIIL